MAQHACEVIVRPVLTGPFTGLARFAVPIPGTISRVDLKSGTSNAGGDTLFDVKVAGVSIFAADLTQRPKILASATTASKTGLSTAVARLDDMTVDLVSVPSGGIGGALAIIVTIDDGVVSGGGGAARGDVALTTASLADLATETGTVALGKSFDLVKVTADRPCRVRLYTTAAYRTADAARAIGTDPDESTNNGIIADMVFQTGLLTLETIGVSGFNDDGTVVSNIYYSVTNMSGATHTVALTFTRRETET